MPSDVRSCGFSERPRVRVGLEQAVVEAWKVREQDVGLGQVAQGLQTDGVGPDRHRAIEAGRPGDAICRP
jgi:hypothetical protein